MEKSMNGNKKRKAYVSQPLEVKINALRKIRKGENDYDIAKDLNVHVETIRSWKKKEKEISMFESNFEGALPKKMRRISKITNADVDKAVWTWFQQRKRSGVPVNGTQIQYQALKVYKDLGGEEGKFAASRGWLHKFKKRHNIPCIAAANEKKSDNDITVNEFLPVFAQCVRNENLSRHQIFNCGETVLDSRNMPETILAARSELSTSGFKEGNERITVMACSNASGSFKLPLAVIGESASSRCIENGRESLVYYRTQKNALMDAALFREWFSSEFVPKVTSFLESMDLPAKAVLLVDNCSSHCSDVLDQSGIKTMFLPSDTTELIQPMDQGILECIKLKYKESIMKHILERLNEKETEVLKSIDLAYVIDSIAKSWDEVSISTIQKSWKPKILEESVSIEDRAEQMSQIEIRREIEILLSTIDAQSSLDKLIQHRESLAQQLESLAATKNGTSMRLEIKQIEDSLKQHDVQITELQNKIIRGAVHENRLHSKLQSIQSMSVAKALLQSLLEAVSEERRQRNAATAELKDVNYLNILGSSNALEFSDSGDSSGADERESSGKEAKNQSKKKRSLVDPENPPAVVQCRCKTDCHVRNCSCKFYNRGCYGACKCDPSICKNRHQPPKSESPKPSTSKD